jgi:hypothetical protein
MGVQLKQGADGGLGLEGKDSGVGTMVLGTINYNVPVATTTALIFYASRAYVLDAIVGRTFVAGTGGAATVSFYLAPSGTAPAAGTVLHSGTFNMVGTINTDQTLTLTTTAIPAGSGVYAVYTGTATSAIGGVSVQGRPV